jgi:hypothetical protein
MCYILVKINEILIYHIFKDKMEVLLEAKRINFRINRFINLILKRINLKKKKSE